jgi:hypothetical protein
VSSALPHGWSGTWSSAGDTLTLDIEAAAPADFVAEKVRIGPVLLDVGLRRRHSTLVVRLVHRQGPVVTLCLRLPSPGPGLVEVDGVSLRGGEVRFHFSGRHEVVAYY